jgi:hypothetical protein
MDETSKSTKEKAAKTKKESHKEQEKLLDRAHSEPTPCVSRHPPIRGCGESGFVTINAGDAVSLRAFHHADQLPVQTGYAMAPMTAALIARRFLFMPRESPLMFGEAPCASCAGTYFDLQNVSRADLPSSARANRSKCACARETWPRGARLGGGGKIEARSASSCLAM